MSDFKITGNPAPEVGKEEFYSVNTLLPKIGLFSDQIPSNTLNHFEYPVTWEVYVLELGKWRKAKGNEKTGNTVSFTFLQRSLTRKGIRIVAKRGEQIAYLDIKTHPAEIPKIQSIELLDINGKKPTKPLAYGQTIKARVHCLHMDWQRVYVTLWEDDADGGGHDKLNEKNKAQTLSGTVKNGIADIDFKLTPDFKKIANARNANEGQTHEYYATAEIFLEEKVSSNNLNVNNSDYRPEPKQPAKKTIPAETKDKSKKDKKGIQPPSTGKKYDWVEEAFKIKPIFLPDPMEFTNSVMKIFVPDAEDEKKKKATTCTCKDFDLVWGGHPNLTCDFKKKVVEISKRQNFDPNHLMAVMWVETYKTFSTSLVKLMPTGKFRANGKPKKDNRGLNEKEIKDLPENFSGAVGLIQFTPVAIDELNNYYNYSLTKRKLALMSQLEQLDYVEKYIEYWIDANKIKSKLTLADLYLLVFSPSKMNGSNDSTTLYKEGTTYYKANESIDTDKENGITKKELAHRAYESLKEGSKKENKSSEFTCGVLDEKKIDDIPTSGVLEEMKIIADSHRAYLQETNKNRTADTEAGLAKMDCSEFVSRYLHKLGITKKIIYMTTANMNNENSFRKIIDNENIDLVEGSKLSTFKPQKGDVFAWGRTKNGSWGGHTGVVYEYDESNDTVTIMEAIGKSGAVGERKQVKNGGDSETNCTRTAIYDRLGGALFGHDGWFGYYRPKNYTKKL
ncbi:CHAP domain-containing protein [Flavobacterium gyeonganense]|uniref:CHAP domain-containing protein n=1 Tax=Flavobacterium gyeonganense TaxID=1310418 RepID=A0ABV5H9R8_9FLAO|nr:CHAP domain-containing protein [Flavobacterium gyeonganense]